MTRTIEEWIGKTDDTKIPARVRLRVFLRHGGVCHLSGRRIQPGDAWDLDHLVALANGGSHSESNLRPALRKPHRAKTARDVAIKAKNDRVSKKHFGIKKPRTITSWRKFDGTIVHAERNR